MTTIFLIVQIIISLTLITLVLIQSRNSGVGAVFGGDSSFKATRRGVEKTLFNLTIVVSIVFFIVALITVLVS